MDMEKLSNRVCEFAATFRGRNIATPDGKDMEEAILALLEEVTVTMILLHDDHTWTTTEFELPEGMTLEAASNADIEDAWSRENYAKLGIGESSSIVEWICSRNLGSSR